jgi:transposase InsO family protein
MNTSDEQEQSHYTFRESGPASSVRLWDVPDVGFTNGSKLMIPATLIGPKVTRELRNDCRRELAPKSSSWSAPFASGSSKLSIRRKEPWQSNGSSSDWECGRRRGFGRSIVSLSAKAFWLNPLTLAAPQLIRRCSREPNVVHQMDLVGPRYLKSKERFYGVHVIDAFSNAVALAAALSKRDTDIVEALVAGWQRLGIPDLLQVDNELSFRGSNRYPRSFGLLIRLCLYLGVEIVFIPPGQPWRNGIVEKFNDVYDKLFFRRQQFKNLARLQSELRQFESFHNRSHRYSKLRQRTPWHVHTTKSRRLLPKSFVLHKRIPWRDGKISFVRLTDQTGAVQFFTEQFTVAPGLVHEYVKGTILTKPGLLKFYHQGRVVRIYRYGVNKN